MKNVTIGTRIKMDFGFGRTVFGTVSDIITNSWGRTAVIFLDNGDVEYTASIDNESGIGCHFAIIRDLLSIE